MSGDIRVSLLRGSDVEVRSNALRQNYERPRGAGSLHIETTSGEVSLQQEE
ncbi:MAG: hypothetical protein ACR2MY_11720 [Candidatus Dormibacteria bacterium]